MIPYSRQYIDEEDIQAVVRALRSDWLTTGPRIAEFEQVFAASVGARDAVAVSSGTAALHAAMAALQIQPGDQVIVPTMTFVATANCVAFQGGTPVFADVDPATLLVDVAHVEVKVTGRTKAIIAVDYAGQPCHYDALRRIADRNGLAVVADACHALGASYQGRAVGVLADLNVFSLHPVKAITTGEGGIITTDRPDLARRMRAFRSHGITRDARQREQEGTWLYEMEELGYNYRLSDFQCALGISQLRKLPAFVKRRHEIARQYDEAFSEIPELHPLHVRPGVTHAYHLYVVQLVLERLRGSRTEVFAALREEGVGVNVHYIPVHLHPYYQRRYGTRPGVCPTAERVYERILSLPIFPAMTEAEIGRVISGVARVMKAFAR